MLRSQTVHTLRDLPRRASPSPPSPNRPASPATPSTRTCAAGRKPRPVCGAAPSSIRSPTRSAAGSRRTACSTARPCSSASAPGLHRLGQHPQDVRPATAPTVPRPAPDPALRAQARRAAPDRLGRVPGGWCWARSATRARRPGRRTRCSSRSRRATRGARRW